MVIIASKIDNVHVHYECPSCKSSYTKTGKPRKNSRPIVHLHGSNSDLSNRTINVSHHSVLQLSEPNVDIVIDDSTIRSC